LNAPLGRPAPLVITGPTGVGKTSVGIEVARRLGGEVLSADSRQIYRWMDIGTAKPTAAERAQVPHHLIDIADPQERYSAGRFGRRTRQVAADLAGRGIAPIVVGGSGLYVTAFVDGLSEEPGRDGELRARLQDRLATEGVESLYRELGRVDPEAQAGLAPGDRQRVLRALELALSAGPRAARPRAATEDLPLPEQPLMVCLYRDRQALYERLERRVVEMVEEGWEREVESLFDRGCARTDPGLESLGYSEIASLVEGTATRPQTIAAIQVLTRRYAKRQLTWLRRDRRLRWLDLDRLGVAGAADRIEADQERRAAGASVRCSR